MLLRGDPEGPAQHLERHQSGINPKLFCQRLQVPLQELPWAHGDLLLELVATDGWKHQVIWSRVLILPSPQFDPPLDHLRDSDQRTTFVRLGLILIDLAFPGRVFYQDRITEVSSPGQPKHLARTHGTERGDSHQCEMLGAGNIREQKPRVLHFQDAAIWRARVWGVFTLFIGLRLIYPSSKIALTETLQWRTTARE